VLGVLGTHSLSDLQDATWIAESLEAIAVRVLQAGLELRFSRVDV
jgi:hypothetical protein